MKKQLTKILSFALFLPVLMYSCKKDRVDKPIPMEEQLQVLLNNQYMPASKIDSAFAIWEVNGTTERVKLQLAGNMLTTNLTNFKTGGTGLLAVQLFTQTKVKAIPLQWERRFTYTLNPATRLSLAAPASITDSSWSPRVICESKIHMANFTAVIALRPEDAYFELAGVMPHIAKRIEVVRSFYQNDTTTLVASRGWIGDENDLDSKGNLVDREHFRNLVEQIDGRPWNKYKIRATFYKNLNPNEAYEVEFEQDKP